MKPFSTHCSAWFVVYLLLSSAASSGERAAVLTGTVQAASSCKTTDAHVWVSKGSLLLYQAMVPAGGTFEFHLVPDTYDVVVTEQGGCFTESRVTIGNGVTKNLMLKAKPLTDARAVPAKNKGRLPATIAPIATCSNSRFQSYYCAPSTADCPTCGANAFPQTGPAWWSGYGRYSYSNFMMPAPWYNYGIVSPYYPYYGGAMAQGGAIAGKPNVYIDAPTGTKIKLSVKYPKNSHMLAAVPAHGKAGWNTEVQAPYRMRSGDSEYSYLFYDYRLKVEDLQRTRGFCTSSGNLLPLMTGVLKEAGFTAYEAKDFEQYWSIKLPKAEEICVYPQGNRDLDKVARLSVTPEPRQITRLVLLVVPTAAFADPASPIRARPTLSWEPEKAPARSPSSSTAKDISVREWGVAFLTVPGPAPTR